jgi:ABC-type nitrate/sulfonate/bicarbonate transport system substrate-binding protein
VAHRRTPLLAALLAGLLAAACGSGGAPSPASPPPAGAVPPGAAAPAPAAAPPLQKIVVAFVSPSEVMAIPWIAKESGLFARYGFDADVPLVTGTPRLVQSLIAGDFDYALPGVTALIRARIQGADPVILAATTNYSTQQLVVNPQADIPSLAALRGRTVGITQFGSEGDTFLRIVLNRVGLAPTDVSMLQMGGTPQVAAAMSSGNLEAGVLGGAPALAAQQAGARKLASGAELQVLSPSGVVGTTHRYVDRDRAAVQRFMRAYVEGIHFFKTQRDETIRIMQQYMGGETDADIAMLYDSVRDLYQPLPVPSEEGIQAVLDRETDLDARGFSPSDFVDTSFLRALDESGFVSGLYR